GGRGGGDASEQARQERPGEHGAAVPVEQPARQVAGRVEQQRAADRADGGRRDDEPIEEPRRPGGCSSAAA
ncbi:hypothetical protein, partial [Actinomadura sp. CNU-125]|uniref:hypothetical protein n=1 Tax=Actinomadura sp. CNU-125 TaxID=1904961 RepID=UPI0021CC5E9E